MNALSLIEQLSTAKNVIEYLLIQQKCLETANVEEVLQIAMSENSGSMIRGDCFQLLYWLTSPSERVPFFRSLLEDTTGDSREAVKALLFRAITDESVASQNPEFLENYRANVKEEYAKFLFPN